MAKEETVKIVITEKFPAEKALRKFKRMCETFGIVKEYKRRQAYEKPSVRNKEKREAAEKRRVKTMKKTNPRRHKI